MGASRTPLGPATEFESRRATVSAGLAARKLDALLVAFSPNLRYLTGFTGSHGCLLIEPERATLFTDPRYRAQAAQETTARVKVSKGALVVDILAAIARRGLHRVGYEPARMTCDLFESLGARLPMKASLAPARGWIENLRMLKSPGEIARIRRSVETNSRAFEAAVRRVRPGMTERDLAAELEYRMRRLGADKPAFETIVAGGARSALPHAQPTAAPLSPGGLVVVDMGAFEDGYASDMTRMLFIGRPGARVKGTYRAVLEAQLAAIDARPPRRGGIPGGPRRAPGAEGLRPGWRLRALHRPRAGPGDPRAAAHRHARQDRPARRHGHHHRAGRLPGRLRRNPHRGHGGGHRQRV